MSDRNETKKGAVIKCCSDLYLLECVTHCMSTLCVQVHLVISMVTFKYNKQ